MKNISIEWTPKAEDWLDLQIEYFEENNYLFALQKLIKGLDKKLILLSKQPEVGRISLSDTEIRFVNFAENYQLYYLFDGQKIQLLDFFDTRQNPSKRPF